MFNDMKIAIKKRVIKGIVFKVTLKMQTLILVLVYNVPITKK